MSSLRRLALSGIAVALIIAASFLQASSMEKAIVRANSPAVIKIAQPRARSVQPQALQLTVKPEVVAVGEPYLINVYTISDTAAPGGDRKESYLGSFSFFPPPKPGEIRTFTLAAPKFGADSVRDLTLRIELVPAVASAIMNSSTLEVVDVKLIY